MPEICPLCLQYDGYHKPSTCKGETIEMCAYCLCSDCEGECQEEE